MTAKLPLTIVRDSRGRAHWVCPYCDAINRKRRCPCGAEWRRK
jgi:hypothetical protein